MLRAESVKTLIPRFFDANATTIRSPATRKKWAALLRQLDDRYPDVRVSEITSDQLRDFLLFDDDMRPRQVAGGTMMTRRTILRSFFSWCEYAGHVGRDPSATLVRTVRARVQPTRENFWLNPEQVSSLFRVTGSDNNELRGMRDSVVLGLGVFCGLRLHEIVKVTWRDLHLETSTLYVLGKGAKPATLPTPKQLVEILECWYDQRPSRGDSSDSVLHPLSYLKYGGERLDVNWDKTFGVDGARDVVKARGAQIGVPNLAPHDLRRTYAGLLEESGVPLREISGLMRHSSVATTEKYLADNSGRWKDSVSSAMAGITISGVGPRSMVPPGPRTP